MGVNHLGRAGHRSFDVIGEPITEMNTDTGALIRTIS